MCVCVCVFLMNFFFVWIQWIPKKILYFLWNSTFEFFKKSIIDKIYYSYLIYIFVHQCFLTIHFPKTYAKSTKNPFYVFQEWIFMKCHFCSTIVCLLPTCFYQNKTPTCIHNNLLNYQFKQVFIKCVYIESRVIQTSVF